MLGNGLHQFFGVEAPFPGNLFKDRMHFDENVIVEDLADIRYCKKGLDPARGIADNRDCSCRGNGCAGRIPHRFPTIKNAAFKVRKSTALLGQHLGRHPRHVGYELHDLIAQFNRFIAVIGNAELNQHISPAHDTETDFAIGLGHRVNLFDRVFVDLDDIVEEAGSEFRDLSKALPIDLAVLGDQFGEVD